MVSCVSKAIGRKVYWLAKSRYLSALRFAASSATSPAPRAAIRLDWNADYNCHIPHQQSACLPRDKPHPTGSGLLPSWRVRADGSLEARRPADVSEHVMRSFTIWCLAILPGAWYTYQGVDAADVDCSATQVWGAFKVIIIIIVVVVKLPGKGVQILKDKQISVTADLTWLLTVP